MKMVSCCVVCEACCCVSHVFVPCLQPGLFSSQTKSFRNRNWLISETECVRKWKWWVVALFVRLAVAFLTLLLLFFAWKMASLDVTTQGTWWVVALFCIVHISLRTQELEIFSENTVATLQLPHGIYTLTAFSQRLFAGSTQGTIYIIDLDAFAIHQTSKLGGGGSAISEMATILISWWVVLSFWLIVFCFWCAHNLCAVGFFQVQFTVLLKPKAFGFRNGWHFGFLVSSSVIFGWLLFAFDALTIFVLSACFPCSVHCIFKTESFRFWKWHFIIFRCQFNSLAEQFRCTGKLLDVLRRRWRNCITSFR